MGGWIYCFVTPSMPGVVKIGATDRDPTERLREAMACTWHIPDYAIACAVEVEEPFAAERRIHAALALRRVHPRREFFRATADETRTLIALTTTVGQTAESADVTLTPLGSVRRHKEQPFPGGDATEPVTAWGVAHQASKYSAFKRRLRYAVRGTHAGTFFFWRRRMKTPTGC